MPGDENWPRLPSPFGRPCSVLEVADTFRDVDVCRPISIHRQVPRGIMVSAESRTVRPIDKLSQERQDMRQRHTADDKLLREIMEDKEHVAPVATVLLEQQEWCMAELKLSGGRGIEIELFKEIKIIYIVTNLYDFCSYMCIRTYILIILVKS